MTDLFSRIDLWIIVAYLLAMLIVAFRVSAGGRDVEGYTVGNRKMSGLVLGFSVLGTFLSSITFLGLPGKTYQSNWGAFVFGLALPPAALVAAWYFVPLYRRKKGRLSAYELLASRLGAWARVYADASYLVLQLIRIGTVLLLVAFAVEPLLTSPASDGTPTANPPSGGNIARMVAILAVLGLLVIIYDTLGGIRAVIWTDVLQVAVLLVGALWCLATVIGNWQGGVGDFFASLPSEKISLGPLTNYDASSGIWDWAAPSVLVVLLYGLTENLRNYGIDQNYVQRMLAAESDREAAKAIWIGALSYVPLSIIFCVIGTGLWMDANLQESTLLPDGIVADQVFPYFIRHALPAPVAGLVIAAILAAAMSTVDSSLNSCSTILLVDILRPLRLIPKNVSEIVAIRLCTVIFGIIGTSTAIILLLIKGQHESKVLMDLWWQYAGTAGGGMFGLFLLAWLMPKVPGWGAAAGVLISIPVLAWGTFARDLADTSLPWLECRLHPFLVGVMGTAVILVVGALCLAAVKFGIIAANPRFTEENQGE